jgi:hypothetical protein
MYVFTKKHNMRIAELHTSRCTVFIYLFQKKKAMQLFCFVQNNYKTIAIELEIRRCKIP